MGALGRGNVILRLSVMDVGFSGGVLSEGEFNAHFQLKMSSLGNQRDLY